MNQNMLTVSQLNRYVKSLLEENPLLQEVYVKGEVSNFVRHLKSGHCYFTLKDRDAAVKCVMFKGNAQFLRFTPEDGLSVLVRGSVSLYERDGSFQLYVTDMQPEGIGALALAYEQLKRRLEAEGLFDPGHKRPIPAFPARIGVVTSLSGAALKDIVNVLSRRYPIGTLVVADAVVQGREAAPSIVAGIREMNRQRACDVLIVGRGGGSLEDLWAFNEEAVVRAVYESAIPVISAVGHEVDFALCDFAADLRAPTPSAAAELASPSVEQLILQQTALKSALYRYTIDGLEARQSRFGLLLEEFSRVSPEKTLEQNRQELKNLVELAMESTGKKLDDMQRDLHKYAALLDSYSPLKVVARGYSITLKDGDILRDPGEASPGDIITTKLAGGELASQVLAKKGEIPS
ncbi:exodeoxyribonuclease VII large subunit [Merdimmobilis hominis]|uniref:exodeoxyribonuclease VII large subunit n=1 Tax=Merdimmobilis hominis TaxID=2897707 RepID=UPI0008F8641C|nr:exodeoxyribonuclease VII large subunit [Merdimmobilis hominis]PWL62533.1 MAG: exodeoxyribonuclease VII large subunit [Oscillospiraceae bacterium]